MIDKYIMNIVIGATAYQEYKIWSAILLWPTTEDKAQSP